MNFDGFWYLLEERKLAFRMECSAKIKLSSRLLSNAYTKRFWVDFRPGFEAILGSSWSSEPTLRALVIKYAV